MFQREIKFTRRFSNAAEHDIATTKSGLVGAIQLATRHDVNTRSQLLQQPQD